MGDWVDGGITVEMERTEGGTGPIVSCSQILDLES